MLIRDFALRTSIQIITIIKRRTAAPHAITAIAQFSKTGGSFVVVETGSVDVGSVGGSVGWVVIGSTKMYE